LSTSEKELTDSALLLAKEHLNNLDLAQALQAIDQSLKKQQQDSGSDLSVHGNLLWTEILLAKGRFLQDSSFPTLALNKLLALKEIIPSLNKSIAFLPLHLLIGESYLQLEDFNKARTTYESILEISKENQHEIGEIQALNGLAKLAFNSKDIETALNLANQSLELLIQHTDESDFSVLVENYLLQSDIFSHTGDFSQAINYAERAIQISEERSLKELYLLASLKAGEVAVQMKDYVLGIRHLLNVKAESMAFNHEAYFAEALLYIGIIYNEVFHYPKSLEYLNLVEEAPKKLLRSTDQVLLLNYLGKSHFLSSDIERAEGYFLKAEKLAKQYQNKPALAFCLAYLGVISSSKSEFNKALRYAKKVNNIREQIGDVDGIQVNLINLGSVHKKLEKYSESIKLTSRGIAAAKRMKDGLAEIRGYQIMAEIFRKQKAFKSAVMYQMIYTKFYEDFYQRNDRQQVSEIEHQFTIQQLEKKIADLSVR